MCKVCRAQLLIPRVSSNTTCCIVCGSGGCVVCVHECVGAHVDIRQQPLLSSILGCLHLSFEIRADIALELYLLDQAP